MAAPGIQILDRDAPSPRTAPTDTGVWFVTGITEKGPTDRAVLVNSLADFAAKFGTRVSYGTLYDSLDGFFREGGSQAYVSRVVGPAAVKAFVNLNDVSTAGTLKVEAKEPGAWANGTATTGLAVQVLAGATGGYFILRIKHGTAGEVLEEFPEQPDVASAIAWATANSQYVNLIALGSGLDPAVVAATALASGADDRASITDTHWGTALLRFEKDLGPGQVSAPNRTTDQAHTDVEAHAETHNRIAILDGQDTATVATLTTKAATLRALTGSERAGLFAPWVRLPGVVPGTARVVGPSGSIAGLLARNDATGNNPNQAAAGRYGQLVYAVDVTQTWTETERATLNDGGVNVVRDTQGYGITNYGFRTLASPTANPLHLQLSGERELMRIRALAGVVADAYVFSQLDGKGSTIAAFHGDLVSMLEGEFLSGALYGDTSAEAYSVDTGPSVNTTTTLSAGELHAVLAVRTSPFAEQVIVEIVRVAIDQPV